MLLSMLTRILARVVAVRLSTWAEATNILSEMQFGFRKARGTEDAIHILRRIHEEAQERVHETTEEEAPMAGLMDLRKAYPSTQRDLMWKVLEKKGVRANGTMMRTLKGMHEYTEYCCRIGGEMSEPYRPKRGLREGCPSSPICFNIFHDNSVLHMLDQRKQNAENKNLGNMGLKWIWKPKAKLVHQQQVKRRAHAGRERWFTNTLLADDTTLFGTRRELQSGGGMDAASSAMRDYEETENVNKREWIELGKPNEVRFLGAYLDLKVDTDKRVSRGYAAWNCIRQQLKKSSIHPRKQALVLRATVMGTMLYACKSRPWREYEIQRLQSVMDKCYRYVLKTNLWKMTEEHKNMFNLRKDLKAPRVKREIEKQVLNWCGHVMRMPNENPVKQTMKGWLDNKATKLGKIGAKPTIPRYWVKLLTRIGINPEFLEHRVADRVAWRQEVNLSYIRGCAEDDEKANQQMETSQTENMAPIDDEPMDDDDEEEETTFRCEMCQEGSFATKKALSVHVQLKHRQQMEDQGGYECRKGCGKKIKTPQARGSHERTCKGSKLATMAEYRKQRNETLHQRRVAQTGSGTHECEICGYKAMSKAGLGSHKRIHKSSSSTSTNTNAAAEPKQVTKEKRQPVEMPDGTKQYPCKFGCGMVSSKAGSIAKHEVACQRTKEPKRTVVQGCQKRRNENDDDAPPPPKRATRNRPPIDYDENDEIECQEQQPKPAITKEKRQPIEMPDGTKQYPCKFGCGKTSSKAGPVARHEAACWKRRPPPEIDK